MHPGPFFGGPNWTRNKIKIHILSSFLFFSGKSVLAASWIWIHVLNFPLVLNKIIKFNFISVIEFRHLGPKKPDPYPKPLGNAGSVAVPTVYTE
jgi:hypothetical protein